MASHISHPDPGEKYVRHCTRILHPFRPFPAFFPRKSPNSGRLRAIIKRVLNLILRVSSTVTTTDLHESDHPQNARASLPFILSPSIFPPNSPPWTLRSWQNSRLRPQLTESVSRHFLLRSLPFNLNRASNASLYRCFWLGWVLDANFLGGWVAMSVLGENRWKGNDAPKSRA